MTLEKEEEGASKNKRGHEMYMENPREGIKNHDLRMECSCSAQIVLCMKRGHSYTIKVFLLPTISTFYSLL